MWFYVFSYAIMAIITSAILISIDWLKNPFRYEIGDYLLTGFIGLFWFIVLPLFLIGYLGNLISKLYIKKS